MEKEKAKKFYSELLLVLTAVIWGFAFVFQKSGGTVGAFSFVTLRMVIAVAVLGAVLLIRKKTGSLRMAPEGLSPREEVVAAAAARREALKGGVICGLFYFLGTALQQVGISDISAGRSGFLTAVYTVLVPLFAALFGKKVPRTAWVGAFLCLGGLYLLCMAGESGFSGFGRGEILTLLCAFGWTFHVLSIDRFAPHVDGMLLSFIQSCTAAVLSLPVTLLVERPSWSAILSIWPELLYVGVMSTAVAYTLQIIGQKHVPPTQATITMSLESVFSVVGGALILGERMTLVQYSGCGLIFLATILAQLPGRPDSNKPRDEKKA